MDQGPASTKGATFSYPAQEELTAWHYTRPLDSRDQAIKPDHTKLLASISDPELSPARCLHNATDGRLVKEEIASKAKAQPPLPRSPRSPIKSSHRPPGARAQEVRPFDGEYPPLSIPNDNAAALANVITAPDDVREAVVSDVLSEELEDPFR